MKQIGVEWQMHFDPHKTCSKMALFVDINLASEMPVVGSSPDAKK